MRLGGCAAAPSSYAVAVAGPVAGASSRAASGLLLVCRCIAGLSAYCRGCRHSAGAPDLHYADRPCHLPTIPAM